MMYLIREYINEEKTEILGSNGWTEVLEIPMSDRHEEMGFYDNMFYWTVYRCRDMNGEWEWDCGDSFQPADENPPKCEGLNINITKADK